MKKSLRPFFTVVSQAIWIYLLLVWAYISIENLIYPASVANSNLGVYFPVPQNLLVIVAFAGSFVFFVIWRYLRITS